MDETLKAHPDFPALKRIILRLAVISHAPIQRYNFAPSDVGRGQRWRTSDANKPVPHLGAHSSKAGDTMQPTGGIDRQGDRTPEYRQKSAQYFARRLERIHKGDELTALLREAEDALDAWLRTPQVAGVDAERGSFLWKCKVADDPRPVEKVCDVHGVSRSTLSRYRSKYRGLLKVTSV